jgi:hypothetical protein
MWGNWVKFYLEQGRLGAAGEEFHDEALPLVQNVNSLWVIAMGLWLL